jgi:ribulose-phosphate 3-epimerase
MEEIVRHGGQLDLIIANTVGPAYSGQPFDERGLKNLRIIRDLLDEHELDIELAVDGSVSQERFGTMYERGARHFVCGTASVFKPNIEPAQSLTEFISFIGASTGT